ncbi:MAG: signal peptidase I [Planctomycetes bacterium]|nr:signal peptidase I [Planctomycetota bacterium]
MSSSQTKKTRHPWRENIEAFTVAIVMAVMLKYFAVEAYQIPTGSMQPTLMGQEFRERGQVVGEVKDRILVDKLSFHYRDPERFEVVIFKYPLNRAQNFVKRLIGLPGDHLKIQNGDLWQRSSASEPWKVLRRPSKVMADQWKAIDLGEAPRGVHWVSDDGREIKSRDVDVAGPAALTFAAHGGGSILDTYAHGYPVGMQESMKKHPEPHRSNANTVGDLRVTGRVTAKPQLERCVIEISEGGRRYRFEIAGPASKEATHVRASWAKREAFETLDISVEGVRLAAGQAVEFTAQNLDDQLRLELDGQEIAAVEVPTSVDQTSAVRIELLGGGALLEELQVWRDIYYLEGTFSSEWVLPAGCYFMMGDNTQDSSDSREWRALRLKWQGSPAGDQPIAGNAREGSGDGRYRPDSNPIRQPTELGMTTFFRDVYGELHIFPKEAELPLAPPEQYANAPFVPRELITGRAVAVFWPLAWRYGTYRVKWIR